MKYSRIIAGMANVLLLSACGGGGSGDSLITIPPLCLFPPCSQTPPPPATVTAYAGTDQTVTEGDSVRISGSADHSRSSALTFEWSQMSGPGVTLSLGPRFTVGLGASFVAPAVTIPTSLTFRLRATGSDGVTNVDSVTILLEPTSASALCLQAPLFETSYAWTNSGCTTDSTDIPGDSRIATVYRQGEAEPNNSLQLANPLTFPMPITTERMATDVAGFVSGVDNDNDDFFVFTPLETGTYQVYLCNDPLVCIRGTVTEKWFLSLSDQNLDVFAGTSAGLLEEQVVTAQLEAGLPYYIGVHVWDAATTSWDYNLTILSGGN